MSKLRKLKNAVLEILYKKGIVCEDPSDVLEVLKISEQLAGLPVPTQGMPFSSTKGRLRNVYVHLTGAEKTISLEEIDEQPKKVVKLANQAQINRFYNSYDWKQIRYTVLKNCKGKCMACNRSDLPLHIDHIKPLRKYWRLRLDINNLQVLCQECNYGKGNWDETDWRDKQGSSLEDDLTECLSQWHFWGDLSISLKNELLGSLLRVVAAQEVD